MSTIALTTPRGETLREVLQQDPAYKPWNVYPRPQLVRPEWINLNGFWDYALGDYGPPERYDRRILVPFPPESSLSGIGTPTPEGAVHWYGPGSPWSGSRRIRSCSSTAAAWTSPPPSFSTARAWAPASP